MPDWTGIRKHGRGWRATISRGRGVPALQRHFPCEATWQEMQAWRKDERARLRLTRKQRATSGTFEYDAKRYLKAVSAMPSFSARERDISLWIAIFGLKRRETITSVDIREWRDKWINERRGDKPPYAASTINHRLRALSNVWTVLDGRRAPNPVRDVPEVREPDALPRGVPYDVIEAILAAVSKRGRPVKGEKNTSHALTTVRLRVLAYTGLTYAELKRMTRADVDFENATMRVARRQKGRGAAGALLPLLPQAVEAFRALDAANAWGHFSGGSIRKTFMLAAAKVRKDRPDLPHTRVYDLRHGFAALVYRATSSLDTVQALLRHTKKSTTQRYTLSAVEDVLTAQLARASSHLVEPDGKS